MRQNRQGVKVGNKKKSIVRSKLDLNSSLLGGFGKLIIPDFHNGVKFEAISLAAARYV
jgi:hypothetical protein